MKIYIAGRYTERLKLARYAAVLEARGHEITSRWLSGSHEIDRDADDDAQRTEFAIEDRNDVFAAECCISFTQKPRSCNSRGGRHVEFGMALANNQRCIVVGPKENVFHWLREAEVYETFEEMLQWI